MDLLPERVASSRLTLRRWTPEDTPILQAAVTASIEHLRPWMSWIAFEPMSEEDRMERISLWHADWAEGGDAVLGAFWEGTCGGGCGLHRRAGPATLEIGYWVHAEHLGNGYALEMAQALTSAAFSVPGITRVEIHHDKANIRSAAIPSALGFVRMGESPDEIAAPAEMGVDVAWSVTLEQWDPVRTPEQE